MTFICENLNNIKAKVIELHNAIDEIFQDSFSVFFNIFLLHVAQ